MFQKLALLRILYTVIALAVLNSCTANLNEKERVASYRVSQLQGVMQIDANWDKAQWQSFAALELKEIMGASPGFIPRTRAKMCYDADNLYLIFKVEDKQIRSVVTEINGPVWDDACVELFFAPDVEKPLHYFNLEINAGGTPLTFFNRIPREDYTILDPEDVAQIEIASSLPETIDPEIEGELTWILECRIPFDILRKYCKLSQPEPGLIWKANLNKTASTSSNPHYITWAPVDLPEPDFHRPDFFGQLVFE